MYLLHDVLEGLYKAFEIHLGRVEAGPHNLDKDEMVIVFGNLLIRHARVLGQFPELRCSDNSFRLDSSQIMEYFEHILEDIHLQQILVGGIQYLLIGEVHLTLFHVDLALEGLLHDIDGVLDNHPLDVSVDLADFGDGLAGGFVHLVVDVQAGVSVGLEDPGSKLFVDENVQADDMETLAVAFWESGFVVVFEEWVQTDQEFTAYLFNLLSEQSNIDALLFELLI